MRNEFLKLADKWLMAISLMLIVVCLVIMFYSAIMGYTFDTNPTITYTYFLIGMAGGLCFWAKATVQLELI